MKLHLPKKLTAALLAACTALALNTTAAAASTGTATFSGGSISYQQGDKVGDLYLTKDITTGQPTQSQITLDNNVNIWAGNDFFASDYTLSIWVTKDSLESNKCLFTYGGKATTDQYGANGITWNADAHTITMGRGDAQSNYTSFLYRDSTTSADLSSYLGTGDLVNLTFSVDGKDGNKSTGQNVDIYVNGVNAGHIQYNGSMNGSDPMRYFVTTAATYGDITITNERLTTASQIYALMGASPVAPGTEKYFVWTGAQGSAWDTTTMNWVTTTAPETPVAFESGAANTVTFGADATLKEVQLATTATVASVAVTGGVYTLELGDSLSTTDLSIATGSILKLTGSGSMAVSGQASIAAGAALSVGAQLDLGTQAVTSSQTPAIKVVDGGVLSLSAASTIDGAILGKATEITTQGFRKMFTGAAIVSEGSGKLVVDGSMNVFDNGTTAGATYQLGNGNVKLVGDVKINANNREVTWAVSGGKTLEVTGDYWMSNKQYAAVDNATLIVGKHMKLAHESNNGGGNLLGKFTATNGANVSLGGIEFVGGGNIVSIDGSTLTFTTTEGNVLSRSGANVTTANTVTINNATLNAVNNSWTMTPMENNDLATVTASGVNTLNVAEEKTLTLTLTNLNEGTFIKQGAGTATVTVSGSLSDTVKVNAGKLVLSGTYAIDHVASGDITVSYIGTDGQPNDNGGFYNQSGTLTVYTVAEEAGAELDRTAATFTYGGEAATVAENGTFVIPGSGAPVFDTLYVKKNTLGFADHQAYAQQHGGSITSVQLANGTTVNMDQAATIGLVLEDGASATVNVTAATTIGTLTGTAVALTGDSTLTIGSSASAASLNGAGTLVINGPTVTINGTNNTSFTGNVDVQAGTLKLGESTGNKFVLGAYNYNTERVITIHAGATLDLNGQADGNYVYTLAGGRLTNTVKDMGNSNSQTAGLKLTANSYVGGEGSKEFWLRQRNAVSGSPTSIELGEFNLTKQGDSTFGLFNTTVTGTGSLVVEGGTVNFNGGSIASNVVLNGGSITGSISAEGEISLTAQQESTLNGLTLLAGQVDIIGTVNVSSNSLDLSSSNKSTGTIRVTDEGVLNVGSTLWMCSNSKIEVEDGGELNIAGLTITSSGEVVSLTSNGNEQYSTSNANFTISNATVTSTGDNVTLGNALTDVSVVVAEGSSLTLNSDADSVTVNGGGTFTLGEGKTVTNLTVEDGGTIAGGVDAKDVTIKAGATGTFVGGVSDIDNGVYIFGMDAIPTIANNGDADAKYAGLQDENMKVTAETLWSNTQGYTVKNAIAVESITHEGGELTLAHVDASPLDNVKVTAGDLVMQDVTAAVLSSMEIASGSTVQVTYTDEQAAMQEGSVTITETLAAGGGTLKANLTLVGDSTLDVAGGGEMALTLGSTLTMDTATGLINLDDATIDALSLLGMGQSLTLVQALDETTLSYGAEDYSGTWYGQMFNRTDALVGDFQVFATTEGFGLTKVSNTPEPTTGTLSLLALAALAARRRRK